MFTAQLSTSSDAREARARRALRRQGCSLYRSRVRRVNVDDLGGYRIVDDSANFVVAGARFELDLDDVEQWIAS